MDIVNWTRPLSGWKRFILKPVGVVISALLLPLRIVGIRITLKVTSKGDKDGV